MARDVCPLCGARNHACGPSGTGTPVSITDAVRTDPGMAELQTYTFTNEDGREVTLRLSADDAKKRGLTGGGSTTKQREAPNKSRTPQNK